MSSTELTPAEIEAIEKRALDVYPPDIDFHEDARAVIDISYEIRCGWIAGAKEYALKGKEEQEKSGILYSALKQDWEKRISELESLLKEKEAEIAQLKQEFEDYRAMW